MTEERRRESDRGFWCVVARRFSDLWDFVDKRQIDTHLMAWAVFCATGYIVYWCMEFVWYHDKLSGLETAAIIGAILLPWTPLQAKVIDWYFKARG
jgi:hypothetical protein